LTITLTRKVRSSARLVAVPDGGLTIARSDDPASTHAPLRIARADRHRATRDWRIILSGRTP
jgi:dipeptidase